jgi:hypothetical protein
MEMPREIVLGRFPTKPTGVFKKYRDNILSKETPSTIPIWFI